MKDMLAVLKRAKEKKVFSGKQEFRQLLQQIQSADTSLQLDWDDDAGEEWARLGNSIHGIVCMISTNIGVVFIREAYDFEQIKEVCQELEVVFTKNYASNEWYVDKERLKREVPEIQWYVSEDSVDANGFSLEDFYFATI